MKRYEEYKPTKYPWLPIVPSHWKTNPMRALTVVSSERRGNREAVLLSVYREYGVIVKSSRDDNHNVESEDLSNYKMVYKGDLVMNKMKMWQGSLGVSEFDGVVSPAYIVCHIIDENINRRYLHMLLRSPLFKTYYNQVSYGVRVGQWDMHYEDFKGMEVSLPPRAEQDQIVRYLDWQVSKINRLIAAKKKQIHLLSAKKYAVVDEYVTHGLQKNVAVKDSGVNWLGTIPAHWSIKKLRTLLKPFSEKNQPDLPLLSVVREKGVIVRDVEDTESNHNFIPDDLSGYKVVHENQFVINKMKAWQGSYGIAPCDGIVSPAYFVFDIDFENLEYFHYAIRSKVYVNFFAQASDGIRVGQWDLSMDKMKNIPFIVPPAAEQNEIVIRIKAETASIEKAITAIEKQIDTLEELRTRLISDIVTGQIDVRDVEIPDFEYTPETDDNDEETDDEESDDMAEEEV